MPEETSLKRNTDDEVLPQGYSEETNDYEVIGTDSDGNQIIRLTGEDEEGNLNRLKVEDGAARVKQYSSIGLIYSERNFEIPANDDAFYLVEIGELFDYPNLFIDLQFNHGSQSNLDWKIRLYGSNSEGTSLGFQSEVSVEDFETGYIADEFFRLQAYFPAKYIGVRFINNSDESLDMRCVNVGGNI